MSTYLSLLIAALGGSLLGLERESEGKAAGLRTHLLVALGAALATQLSMRITGFGALDFADPGRIAAQVVSGIGFIGAGVILQSRGSIRGLTTAATLWVAAMIGMAAGMEAYAQAAFVTLLALIALRSLNVLDAHFRKKPHWHMVEITWEGTPGSVGQLLESVGRDVVTAHTVESAFVKENESGCRLRLRARQPDMPEIVYSFGRAPDVKEVRTL